MSEDIEEAAWLKLGVARELGRRHAADSRAMLQELAALLEEALPGETRVERRGLLAKTVRALHVELPDGRLSLEESGHRLKAGWTHVVRGISLKSEEIPVAQWLEQLDEALRQRSAADTATREALARFLG